MPVDMPSTVLQRVLYSDREVMPNGLQPGTVHKLKDNDNLVYLNGGRALHSSVEELEITFHEDRVILQNLLTTGAYSILVGV
jgi:hypothetical protein